MSLRSCVKPDFISSLETLPSPFVSNSLRNASASSSDDDVPEVLAAVPDDDETDVVEFELADRSGGGPPFGPPGGGKSMLACRLPGVLPPLTPAEALEVSMIHSVAGLLDGGRLVARPPYREPHHGATQAALTGGGQRAKPGEVSLAHRGVLFLDEVCAFAPSALDALRQPLEEGRIDVARAMVSARFPARTLLVCAGNPCPCGFDGDPVRLVQ